MVFFRLFQHLLPRSRAWATTTTKTLRQFFEGLAGAPTDAKTFIDQVLEDAFPDTTRELPTWETQMGLTGQGTDTQRRALLSAEWKAPTGQSPAFLESVLATAGFTAYVYPWWESTNPYVPRDPRAYTGEPVIGTYQCAAPDYPDGQDVCSLRVDATGSPLEQPQCDAFLQNDPGYLVNLDLTRQAPPRIPDDPSKWRHFVYVAGATFPEPAIIPADQLEEFKRQLLKRFPTEAWIVYITEPATPTPLGLFMWDIGGGWDNSIWENK